MKYRMQRQKLRSRRKNKGKDDVPYIPGAVSSKVIPDSEVNTPVIVSDNVIFVSDNDIKEFIVLNGFWGLRS